MRAQRLREPEAAASGPSDQLLLDNGDQLSGTFRGLANDAVKLDADLGPIDIPTDRITALLVKPRPAVAPSDDKRRFQTWVGLSDGSRLLATQLSVEGQAAKIISVGQPFTLARSAIVFLQPLGGRAVYLSDLKPAEYRQTPYLDLPWPYHNDRNVTGGFLRCHGHPYLKGLGVHSAARLEYTLGQGVRAKRFEAELGVDDSTAGQGSVRFRVLVDGQEKYASPILRGGGPPAPISIGLSDANKLELLVDYADRADVLDHADWLNARLIR